MNPTNQEAIKIWLSRQGKKGARAAAKVLTEADRKRNGALGGRTAAKNLTKAQRQARARKAARARHNKKEK